MVVTNKKNIRDKWHGGYPLPALVATLDPGGGGVRSKVLYGEALPRVTLFQKPFSTGYPSPLPFVYLLWTNVAPFTYLHPFELL